MTYIKVDINKLRNYSSEFSSIKTRVSSIKRIFSSISSALDWDVKSSSNIQRSADNITGNLDTEISSLNNMIDFVSLACNKYEILNGYIIGILDKTSNRTNATINPSSSPTNVDLETYCLKVSDAEYARLCSKTYELFDKSNPTAKDFIDIIQKDDYFTDNDPLKLITEEQITVLTGFSGFQAVVIEDGKNAIVVFVGTNGDIGDYVADAQLALGIWSFQELQAISLVGQLSKKYDNIVVSGHSLGGYLATAATLFNDTVSKCVTFDPPGRSDPPGRGNVDVLLHNVLNGDRVSVITTYEAKGSLISSVGQGVGTIYKVDVKESGGAIDHNHSIDNLCDALGGKSAMESSWD